MNELCERELMIFFGTFAKRIWDLAPLLQPNLVTDAHTFEKALHASKKITNLPPSGLSSGTLFPWICWTIWTSRNQLIFENRVITAEDTLSKAVCLAKEWQEAQVQAQDLVPSSSTLANRVVPSTGLRFNSQAVLVHTDAAWKSDTNKAGVGWIFSDSEGNIISTHSKAEDFIASALIAEGLAIREALLQARQKGYTILTVNSDAQNLV
ncbi:hypothetical protein Bca101_056464 [Brassica carinata]